MVRGGFCPVNVSPEWHSVTFERTRQVDTRSDIRASAIADAVVEGVKATQKLSQNPYRAGNPVGGSPAFIGREGVLRSVLRTLESPSENAIVLYGQRRIGKTSVLLELAERLRRDGPYHPVYFDLQDKAALPLGQVVKELAQRLATELQLPSPPNWGVSAPEAFGKMYLPSVLYELPEGHSWSCCSMSSMCWTLQPRTRRQRYSFRISATYTVSPRLQFVFVIGRRPEDLSNLTLSVFKGVRSERVSLLDRADTERLIRLSERDGSMRWTDQAVLRVITLTGGHPLLTQQLCQELWELVHEDQALPPTATTESVDAAAWRLCATLPTHSSGFGMVWPR